MKYKERPKPKTVRTTDYNCAHISIMAILIIFPVILQTKSPAPSSSTFNSQNTEWAVTISVHCTEHKTRNKVMQEQEGQLPTQPNTDTVNDQVSSSVSNLIKKANAYT